MPRFPRMLTVRVSHELGELVTQAAGAAGVTNSDMVRRGVEMATREVLARRAQEQNSVGVKGR